jgi:hypothetical protein
MLKNLYTPTRGQRKAARTCTAHLLNSARPRLETYAVRWIARQARTSAAQASVIAEQFGLSTGDK